MLVCSFLDYAVPSGVFSAGDRKVRLCIVGTMNELVRRSFAGPEAKRPLFSASVQSRKWDESCLSKPSTRMQCTGHNFLQRCVFSFCTRTPLPFLCKNHCSMARRSCSSRRSIAHAYASRRLNWFSETCCPSALLEASMASQKHKSTLQHLCILLHKFISIASIYIAIVLICSVLPAYRPSWLFLQQPWHNYS